MKYVPAGLVAFAVDQIVEMQRALDGQIYNVTTGKWEPATPVTEAAAEAAINATMGAVLDTLPFPIEMGAMGSIDRSQAEAMVAKVVTAMKAYRNATSKIS